MKTILLNCHQQRSCLWPLTFELDWCVALQNKLWWEWREGKGEKGQGESEMESGKGMSQTLGMEKERGWEKTRVRKTVGEMKVRMEWQENGKRWRGRVKRWRVEGLNLAAKSLQGKSGLLKVIMWGPDGRVVTMTTADLCTTNLWWPCVYMQTASSLVWVTEHFSFSITSILFQWASNYFPGELLASNLCEEKHSPL